MAATKSGAQTAEKWSRVTPMRSEDYKMGVMNPRAPWAASSTAAQDRYKQGVTEAANRGAYGKGIAAAGDQKWQRKSAEKGPQRFAEGVALSTGDYQAGVQPYLDVIAATTLPPRFPKGDPRNIARVATLAAALRKRKTG
jgi:hypothetical protein